MSDHLTEEDLLNELFEFEKSEAATIEQNGPGRWGFIGWNAPKNGRVDRPIGWIPSRDAWLKQAAEFSEQKAEEAKKFAEELEEREKSSAGSREIEVGFGGHGRDAAKEESRRPIELVIG